MSEETKESISKENIYTRYIIHTLLTVVIAAGTAWFSNEIILDKMWNPQYYLFAGAILAVILLYSLLERKKIYASFRTVGILTACFVVSALLLLLSDYYVNLPIWLIGGIVVAALVDRNLGMQYLYFFVYHAVYLQGSWLNGLIFHFVIATLIAFVIPKMKTFLGMFYMMAFSACVVVTGSVIHNKMCIDESMMLDTFYILCTYLVCILVTMLLVKWTGEQQKAETEELVPGNYEYLDILARETAKQDEELAAIAKEAPVEFVSVETAEELTEVVAVTEEIVTEEAVVEETVIEEAVVEETVTEEAVVKETVTEETVEEHVEETATQKTAEEIVEEEVVEEIIDYAPYCSEKSELMMELRAKNKSIYAQAVLVGKLAAETAKSIGLNAELTKAAGFYKRIGKIREENDEYTSTEIAREHNFPEPLIYLLDQLNHNIIEQKEAALLLITDGVISYYSIVRHVQKTDIPVEKIVDKIVTKKIFQGEFNESGLSVGECYMLREKLIDLLKSQDKKHAAK